MQSSNSVGSEQLSDISRLKRKITFGNIPDAFHSILTSINIAEGSYKYGFENSIDMLLNKSNWNLKRLGGSRDFVGKEEFERFPKLTIFKLFTPHGFEVHALPYLRNSQIDHAVVNHPECDFKEWHPGMKVLFRISNLHQFIKMTFDHGDDADLELIKYAHNLSEEFVDYASKLLHANSFGVSVKGFYDYAQKRARLGEEVVLPVVYRTDEYGHVSSREI